MALLTDRPLFSVTGAALIYFSVNDMNGPCNISVVNAPLTSTSRCAPSMNITRASVDMSFGGGALRDETVSNRLSALYPSDKDSALCVESILRPRRFRNSTCSSYLRITSVLPMTPPMSDWYDDSPRQETFSISDAASYDISDQQWFDEDDDDSDERSVEMTNRLSILTFGVQSSSSSSLSFESQDSRTMVATDDDSDSLSSSSLKTKLIDCLDEELICSPIDSFAALCWDSAVSSDQPQSTELPKMTREEKMAQLRLSTLYGDDAEDYEEEQSIQNTDLDALALPPMEFVSKPQIVSSEVAPWLHISRKAASVLDIPQDLFTLAPFEAVPQSRRRQHRRGMSLGLSQEIALARCKKGTSWLEVSV
ncbi:hypothetical protein BU17DRAFT_83485 [Hysterangium stoloniferum]|nr:hypothetical protein BU17DRAFT_83485 [Hysterangium stoloniferum]